MADTKSDGVEVLTVSEKVSKGKASSKAGSAVKTKNGTAKVGQPKPISSPLKEEKGDVVVESPQKKPVIVIDLTDDSEEIDQKSDDKKDTKADQPKPIVVQSIKLIDLKEKALESMVELSQYAVATFVGKRGNEKEGILELTLESDKDQKKALTSLEKVTVSDKRELSATVFPSADADFKQSMLSKLREDESGNDKELTSVFINNIPPEARSGILKLMFPTARNIQFPQDNDGNSQGYAVLEVAGRKAAVAIIKHHELYVPKIGSKVFKLHIVGETSALESETEKVLSDEISEETSQKKGEDKAKITTPSKTQQDSTKKANPDITTKTKTESSKLLKKESAPKPDSVKRDKSKSIEQNSERDRSSISASHRSSSSQKRTNRSRSRSRRRSRDGSRRSRSADRRNTRRELHSKVDNNRSTASRPSRSPGSAARPSRWEIGSNNHRAEPTPRPQRTQSLSTDRLNQRGSSLTGLNGPHELMMAGNAGMRGGVSGQVGNPGQRGYRQGTSNIGPGNPISQQRNQLRPINKGMDRGILNQRGGLGGSVFDQRSTLGQRNVMTERGNPIRDRPTPLIGPGSQMIQPTPALVRQGNQAQGNPQLGQSDIIAGNHMVSQSNSITRQGIQMMGHRGQMNLQGTPTVAQMNPILAQSAPVQQQHNQFIGQGTQLMGQVNPMMGQAALMGQGNQVMGQGNQMFGQSNPMMRPGNQMMAQNNQMMGLGTSLMGQRAPPMGQPMMGQQTSTIVQDQIKRIQMGGQSNQLTGRENQMGSVRNAGQVMQSGSVTGAGNYGSGLSSSMVGTSASLPVATITQSFGRNAGVTQGQMNISTPPHSILRDTRRNDLNLPNRRAAEQVHVPNRLSNFDNNQRNSSLSYRKTYPEDERAPDVDQTRRARTDDRKFSTMDVQRTQSKSNDLRQSSPTKSWRGAIRRDDSQQSDSHGRFSDRGDRKDTGRSSRFDRSRSPVRQQSQDMEQRRGNRSHTAEIRLEAPANTLRGPSRFDDRGTGSADRNSTVPKSRDSDRRRQTQPEQPQQTRRSGPGVTSSPDLSNIRNQLMNTLRQLETGSLSDTAELADIAEKIKQVQQQKLANPQETIASSRLSGHYREESLVNPSENRHSFGRGSSFEPRGYSQRRSPSSHDLHDRQSSGNRSEDISSKVTIDYGHQIDSRSRFRDEPGKGFQETRVEKDYRSERQAGYSDSYGSGNIGSSRFDQDTSRDLQRQGFVSEEERNRRQPAQYGSGGMHQHEGISDTTWGSARQGYGAEKRTSDGNSFNNFSSTSFGAGDPMARQGIVPGQSQPAFRNQPPWQKSSNNPPPLMSSDRHMHVAQTTERPKKVYVGNLPATAKWDDVAKFFNIEMWKRRMTSPVSLNKPVTGVVQAPDRSYAYVMFNTADEADGAVLLDGIRYENNILNIKSSLFTR